MLQPLYIPSTSFGTLGTTYFGNGEAEAGGRRQRQEAEAEAEAGGRGRRQRQEADAGIQLKISIAGKMQKYKGRVPGKVISVS